MENTKIISRKFAIENGLKRYFSGVPCLRGHISERFVTSGLCVECNKFHGKNKWNENKEHLKKENKKWRQKNKQYILEKNKIWKSKNHEKIKEMANTYYEKNKERLKPIRAKYREKTKDQQIELQKKWLEKNKTRKYATRKEWRKNKLKTDCMFIATEKIRNLTSDAFRRFSLSKLSKTIEVLGCTFIEAKTHIEQQFSEGMSWKNHGDWHIDHIIPLSSAKNYEELVLLGKITNLQPLWAIDNLKKGSKVL